MPEIKPLGSLGTEYQFWETFGPRSLNLDLAKLLGFEEIPKDEKGEELLLIGYDERLESIILVSGGYPDHRWRAFAVSAAEIPPFEMMRYDLY